ncbi:MAG TPA: GNAT family N-acyltransferase [Myxococcota bacterium]|nr:GNAT family N-acyltransferase [Myxococcota bacterium]
MSETLSRAEAFAPIRHWREDRGPYRVRFARTRADLEAVQRLRYEVFAGELGARVVGHEQARDIDFLDDHIDHLLVVERETGACVGTYRLATLDQVGADPGYYSARIFDLDALGPQVGEEGVELGRACVSADHRIGGVFGLLLRGIGSYLVLRRKRFLFGCGSVPLADVSQAEQARRLIADRGWLDPSLCVKPRGSHDPAAFMPAVLPGRPADGQRGETAGEKVQPRADPSAAPPSIPRLLSAYTALGARLAADPAWDPDFRTLDFFVLLDLERVDPRTFARYCQPR